jgi:2-polyprenyl-3-methyl-5-hydroxy-6-metoxy-1,4-benzoquinol methylase
MSIRTMTGMRRTIAFRKARREFRHAKFRLFGYSKLGNSPAQWEREYESGNWAYLGRLSELAHYSIVTGYCLFFESETILDVGCGQGVLTRMLQTVPYRFYQGIDISARAILDAETRYGNEKTLFTHSDAVSFQPARRFDTIIFNECLCYFDDPARIVRQYKEYLEPGGRIIVSAFSSGQEREMFRLVGADFALVDSVIVVNDRDQRWNVRVFA